MSDGERSAGWGWPVRCPRCEAPVLPLSDYGQEGATVLFKTWACLDDRCGYAMRVDKGVVSYGARRDDEGPAKRRSNER